MRKNTMVAMAVAAAMQTMQRAPEALRTVGHKIAAGGGHNPGGRRRTKNRNKNSRRGSVSKYTSHQGAQECARRLRVGSAAWHSGIAMSDFPF